MTFVKMPKRRGVFCKFISILLIQTFLLSNIAFAITDKIDTAQTISKPKEIILDPEKIIIPREYGLVKSKFAGSSDRLIIHIQDAHCNYEAQSNIVSILENLVRNSGLEFISVEGADGFIDTSWFRAFPDDEVRKEVATYFMKKGEITGPEFLSITSDYPIKLFGAETRSYYIQNLNAFTSSYPLKEETEKYYNQMKTVINRLKAYVYSDDLKTLDGKIQDYESKKLQFNEYIRFIEGMAQKLKINLREYDNVFKLVSALIYEKKIDFNVTDRERSALIDELSKKLPKDTLTELVTRSLTFKVGKISSVEYYDYLKGLAVKNGIEVSKKYPNLYNYIIYNAVYSKIENEKLFSDIKRLETNIKEKLFTNDDQRTLDKLSRHTDILLGLINIKLLNNDFEYFKSHKDEFKYEVFADFLKKKAAQYGLAYEISLPSDAVVQSTSKLEDFYEIAVKRDKALVDNTLNQMKKDKLRIGVLITGGFHSEGITKLLEKQGVSYMVICPSITKDAPSPYIQILTNQRTPFEDILVTATDAKGSMVATMSIFELLTWARTNPKVLDEISEAVKAVADGKTLEERAKVFEGEAQRIYDLLVEAQRQLGRIDAKTQGSRDAYYNEIYARMAVMFAQRVGLSQKMLTETLKARAETAPMVTNINLIFGRLQKQVEEQEAARKETARREAAKGKTKKGDETPGTGGALGAVLDLKNARLVDERVIRPSFDQAGNMKAAEGRILRNDTIRPGFQFVVHNNYIERCDANGLEAEIRPGRGGKVDGRSRGLIQAHMDAYVYDGISRQNAKALTTIANHELAHLDIFNFEEMSRTMTEDQLREFGQRNNPIGYRTWLAWKKAGKPVGKAQENFINNVLPKELGIDCNISGEIERLIARLTNERRKQITQNNPDFRVKKENVDDLKSIVKNSQGARRVIGITNSRDGSIVKRILDGIRNRIFRNDGATNVKVHEEATRRGQFLGLLEAQKAQALALQLTKLLSEVYVAGLTTAMDVKNAFMQAASARYPTLAERIFAIQVPLGMTKDDFLNALIDGIGRENFAPDVIDMLTTADLSGIQNGEMARYELLKFCQANTELYKILQKINAKGLTKEEFLEALEGVMLGIMMPGQGTRFSPFTQRLIGIKPLAPMLVRTDEECPWLSGMEASLYSWNLVAKNLERMGFRGIAWKWGDEPQISANRLKDINLDLKDADIVRFGSKVSITDYLAENKEWLNADTNGNLTGWARRRPRAALIEKFGLGGVADPKAMVHIGSPALSHLFVQKAIEVFGDLPTYVMDPATGKPKIGPNGRPIELWIDVDGYLIEALTMTRAQWDAEIQSERDRGVYEKGIKVVLDNCPDFYQRCQEVRRRINKAKGRAPDAQLNIKVMDFGEKLAWYDIGTPAKAREATALLTKNTPDGEFAREMAGIAEVRPGVVEIDEFGNRVVGKCSYPKDGSIRNSVLINSNIYGVSNIDGAVIVNSTLGDADIGADSVVYECKILNLTMGQRAFAFESIGDDLIIHNDWVHTSLPSKLPVTKQELEAMRLETVKDVANWRADSRVDVSAKDIYEKKGPDRRDAFGNPDSFAGLQMNMRKAEYNFTELNNAINQSAYVMDLLSRIELTAKTRDERIQRLNEFMKTYSPVPFGTSGLRSDDRRLTDLVVFANQSAYNAYLKELNELGMTGGVKKGDAFALGGDFRPSTYRILRAIMTAIFNSDLAVSTVEHVPTPAITYYGMYATERGMPSDEVTASHNPYYFDLGFGFNGIKFNRPDGEILKFEEAPILLHVQRIIKQLALAAPEDSIFGKDQAFKKDMPDAVRKQMEWRLAVADKFIAEMKAREDLKTQASRTRSEEKRKQLITESEGPAERMSKERITDAFGQAFDNEEIICWQHTAVGRDILPEALGNIGAKVYRMNRIDRTKRFLALDTEDMKPQYLKEVRNLVWEHYKKYGRMPFAIVTTDGDSDRPAVFYVKSYGKARRDLKIEFINGDRLGVLASIFLKPDIVSAPVTANDRAMEMLKSRGVDRKVTQIGSPYVIDATVKALKEAAKKEAELAQKEGRPPRDFRGLWFEVNGGMGTHTDWDIRGLIKEAFGKETGGTLRALPTRSADIPIIAALLAAKKQGSLKGLVEETFSGKFESYNSSGGIEGKKPEQKTEEYKFPGCENYTVEMGLDIYNLFSPKNANITEVNLEEGAVLYKDGKRAKIDAALSKEMEEVVVKDLKRFFTDQRGFGKIAKVNYFDGIRVYFQNGEIYHLRKSGNEPKFRYYTYGLTPERTAEMTKMGLPIMAEIIKYLTEISTPGIYGAKAEEGFNSEEFIEGIFRSIVLSEKVAENPEERFSLREYVAIKYAEAMGRGVETLNESDQTIIETFYKQILQRVNETRVRTRIPIQQQVAAELEPAVGPVRVHVGAPTELTQQGGLEFGPVTVGVGPEGKAIEEESPYTAKPKGQELATSYRDRGWHDLGYIVTRLYEGMIALGKWAYRISYSMTHFGELHAATAFGAFPLIPNTPIYQSTGSHSQGLSLDIKRMRVPGIQQIAIFDKEKNLVVRKYMYLKPGDWAFSLPGSIDIFTIQTGGNQFYDRSITVSTAEMGEISKLIQETYGVEIDVETLSNPKFAEELPAKGMPYIFYRDEKGQTKVTVHPKYEGKVTEAPEWVKPFSEIGGRNLNEFAQLMFSPAKISAYEKSPEKQFVESDEFVLEVVRKTIGKEAKADTEVPETLRNLTPPQELFGTNERGEAAKVGEQVVKIGTLQRMQNACAALDGIIREGRPIDKMVLFRMGIDGYKWGQRLEPNNFITGLMGKTTPEERALAVIGNLTPEQVAIFYREYAKIPGEKKPFEEWLRERIVNEPVAEHWIGAGEINTGTGYPLPITVLSLWENEVFGPEHVAQFGAESSITAKILTSAQELSLQMHTFPEMIMPLESGKAYLGLKKDIAATEGRTPEEELIRACKEGTVLEEYLQEVTLEKGVPIIVPAYMPHAYGNNVRVYEVKAVTSQEDKEGTISFFDRLKFLGTRSLAMTKEELTQMNPGRLNKDVLTMTPKELEVVAARLKEAQAMGGLKKADISQLKFAPILVNAVGPKTQTRFELVGVTERFVAGRYNIEQGVPIEAELLTQGREHHLFVEKGKVELRNERNEKIGEITQGPPRTIPATAGKYKLVAIEGPAVVYTQYRPLDAEARVVEAYEAFKANLAKIQSTKIRLITTKKAFTGGDEHDPGSYNYEQKLLKTVSADMVELKQFEHLDDIPRLLAEGAKAGAVCVIQLTEDEIKELAARDDKDPLKKAVLEARITPLPKVDIIKQKGLPFIREMEVAGVLKGIIDPEKDIKDKTPVAISFLNLMKRLTGNNRLDWKLVMNYFKVPDPSDPLAFTKRINVLLKELLITMPMRAYEADKELRGRRELLWAV